MHAAVVVLELGSHGRMEDLEVEKKLAWRLETGGKRTGRGHADDLGGKQQEITSKKGRNGTGL